MTVIYPTLLAFDLLNAQKEIERLEPFAQGYQLDIMDNHFVPNITYGADFVNAATKITYKKIWVHLMTDGPMNWVGRLDIPNESIVTFHIEATTQITETINFIKGKGWLPSIAINPDTKVERVFPFLNIIHQVSLMSVEPGFPSQLFIKETFNKLSKLRGYRQTSGLTFRIAMDGGINSDNIGSLVKQGVDDLAISTAIFKSEDPLEALKQLTHLAEEAEKELTFS